MALYIGLKGEAREIATREKSAAVFASGALEVYSTPAMIGLMEAAAHSSAGAELPEGETTVGTMVNIRHLAATPLGMEVRAVSELVEIDGRRLVFRIEAYDEQGKIGEGTHERYIVNAGRFLEKTARKKAAP